MRKPNQGENLQLKGRLPSHAAGLEGRDIVATSTAPALFCDVNGLVEISGIPASNWNKARLAGDGPPFVRWGRLVRYHIPTFVDWLNARQHQSTSDYPHAPSNRKKRGADAPAHEPERAA